MACKIITRLLEIQLAFTVSAQWKHALMVLGVTISGITKYSNVFAHLGQKGPKSHATLMFIRWSHLSQSSSGIRTHDVA